jgi:hypothetical protein
MSCSPARARETIDAARAQARLDATARACAIHQGVAGATVRRVSGGCAVAARIDVEQGTASLLGRPGGHAAARHGVVAKD